MPPPRAQTTGGAQRSGGAAPAAALEADPFPKAPVLPFRVESASLAITSVVDLLIASAVPAVLIAPDSSVKFVSDQAKKLLGPAADELSNLKAIESATGMRIPSFSAPLSAGVQIGKQSVLCSVVPLSGGAAGAVIVFRAAEVSEGHASFTTYVQEAVLGPLRSLRESLLAVATSDEAIRPLLGDAAATVDQVLSSLELAPGVDSRVSLPAPVPTVTDVVHQVADRFRPFAELKNVRLQLDAHELDERFPDHERLAECLGILLDNAIHYVPAGGQVVAGVRWMEHKGKPLFLFFVMDTGPLVPERLRHSVFDPDFVWNPTSSERTGRSLFKTREFAMAHEGSVWVDSRTGKACTFFLRIRPESAG